MLTGKDFQARNLYSLGELEFMSDSVRMLLVLEMYLKDTSYLTPVEVTSVLHIQQLVACEDHINTTYLHLVTREVTSILNDTQSTVKVTPTHNIEHPVNGKGHINTHLT